MFEKLYDRIEPMVGEKAANAGVRLQYVKLISYVVVMLIVGIMYLGPVPSSLETACALVAVALTPVAGVIARIQFAHAVSEHLRVKVFWYRLPYLTKEEAFEKWYEGVNSE